MKKAVSAGKNKKKKGKKSYQPPQLVEIENFKSAKATLPPMSGPPMATPIPSSPSVSGKVIF